MAAYTWPVSLPQNVRQDFQTARALNILSTPMDLGSPKRRRRGLGVEQLKVGFYMTTAQIATLETFVQSTIKGTARFDFAHPVTGATVEVRIVPQSDGQLYTVSYHSPTLWLVDMMLEVVP
jgi:hypothetical protein